MTAEWIFGMGLTFGLMGGVVLRDAFDLYRQSRIERRAGGRHARH